VTLLKLLNFVVLQWLFVRLQVTFSHVALVGEKTRWWDREIAVRDEVRFDLIRWVWPLTGWWTEYRYVWGRRSR